MSYLIHTLDYLPKLSEESTTFKINCSGEYNSRTLYDMSIDMDGSMVGNVVFSHNNRTGIIFIRESNIRSGLEYLMEEGLSHIKDSYDKAIILAANPDSRIEPLILR